MAKMPASLHSQVLGPPRDSPEFAAWHVEPYQELFVNMQIQLAMLLHMH